MELERYLEDIENRIDADTEQMIADMWEKWCNHKPYESVSRKCAESKLDWSPVNINDAVADDDLMIYSELYNVHQRLIRPGNYVLRVRPNYGVGNVATAFGAKPFIMPYETNTLPNVIKLGEEKCRELADKPIPDVYAGSFESVYRIAARLKDIRKTYPKFSKFVHIEQPDLQGPMDNLELLYGSDVFYAFYDDPELVHVLLDKITCFIEKEFDTWLDFFPGNRKYTNFFRHIEHGSLCVRNDSAMNLSPDLYEEFIVPYDGRLLKKYGGIVHFCGRGDHFISKLAKLEGLRGINMSQPHLNDMEKVFSETIDRGIHLTLSVPPFEVKGHKTENLIFLHG